MTSRLRSRPKRWPKLDRLLAEDFHKAGRGRCVGCGNGSQEAHHGIYAQELRRRRLNVWAVANAVPVCRDCHAAHHNRSRPLLLETLPARMVAFAFEALGEYAIDYLGRRYACPDGEWWVVYLPESEAT